MTPKPWTGICSKSCWEATEKRCRCKCQGRYHGGKTLKRLDEYIKPLHRKETPPLISTRKARKAPEIESTLYYRKHTEKVTQLENRKT